MSSAPNNFGAGGFLLPGSSVAGGAPATDPPRRLGRPHSDATKEKIRQSALRRGDYSPAKIERIKAMAAAGASIRQMCRAETTDRATLIRFCDKEGIPLPMRPVCDMEAGARVLREQYETNFRTLDVFRAYVEARKDDPSRTAMRQHAKRLGLVHAWSGKVPDNLQVLGALKSAEMKREQREAKAPALIAAFASGMHFLAACRATGISEKTARRLIRDGVVPQPPKRVRPRKEKAPRPPRVRVVKPLAPPPPRKLPASYVRAPAPPPKPRATYESVEAWLAAGNRITHCPTAAVERTTATIPEADRAAIAARNAAIEAEEARLPKRAGARLRQQTWRRAKIAAMARELGA